MQGVYDEPHSHRSPPPPLLPAAVYRLQRPALNSCECLPVYTSLPPAFHFPQIFSRSRRRAPFDRAHEVNNPHFQASNGSQERPRSCRKLMIHRSSSTDIYTNIHTPNSIRSDSAAITHSPFRSTSHMKLGNRSSLLPARTEAFAGDTVGAAGDTEPPPPGMCV